MGASIGIDLSRQSTGFFLPVLKDALRKPGAHNPSDCVAVSLMKTIGVVLRTIAITRGNRTSTMATRTTTTRATQTECVVSGDGQSVGNRRKRGGCLFY